jgi:glycosyltransferase involved in cell wall biosynthesis
MRFLFVMPFIERYSPTSGGAVATITASVARELLIKGHEVDVIAPDDGQPIYSFGKVSLVGCENANLIPILGHLEARIRGWNWPGEGRYLEAAWKMAASKSPDVVVLANDLENAAVVRQIIPSANVVVWLHNECALKNRALFNPSAADVYLCCSEYIRKWFLLQYSVDPKLVHTAYAGVDETVFWAANFSKKEGPLRLLFSGRLDRNKGVDLALDAVERLKRKGFPVQLQIAGDAWFYRRSDEMTDPFVQNMRSQLRSNNCEWYGHVPRFWLPDLMRSCDVAMILSRSNEPFGLVVLEAMASGLAVIASNRGGLPEACGEAAILLDPENSQELDQNLEMLCRDGEVLQQRKRKSVHRALKAKWSATADGLLRAIKGAANGRKSFC